jgi:hypothetical protein
VRYGCIGWQCKERSYDDFVIDVVAAVFMVLVVLGDTVWSLSMTIYKGERCS